MKTILGLAVMACVVFGASLTAIDTNSETGKSARRHQASDEEILIILGNGLLPGRPQYKPQPFKPDKSYKNIPKCMKKECINESKSMFHLMDTSVDPCEDFYQYACGGWLRKPLPDDHAQWSVFTRLSEQNENLLKRLIEEQENSDNSVGKLVYNWYAACMDEDERDKLGAGPLLELIHNTMGEQFNPFVPNDFSGEDWVLEDVLGIVHSSLNVFPFFTINLGIDPLNSSSPTHLSISEAKPMMRLHDSYLSQEEHNVLVTQAYMVLMANLTRLLGALDYQDANSIIPELKEILLLEVDLIKAMKNEEKEEEKGNKWTLKDFQANLPEFNWTIYFTELTADLSNNNSFSESEVVFIEAPLYLAEVVKILKNRPKGVVANYITWLLIHEYGPYLSTKFHDAYLTFAKVAYGIKRGSALWRRCVRGTTKSVDMGVSMLFVTDKKSEFTNGSMHHADQMVENIREAFIDNLKSVNWMDEKTKQAAEEKAEAMIQQIGYPPFITNLTSLEQYFSGLEANPKTFFNNRLMENKIRMKNTLAARGQPPSRFRWDMLPTESNAYYSVESNKIVVPAGILTPPFYHIAAPHAQNFGGIGFVVGHELTHAFDSQGAMFDKNGNLKNWWDKESFSGFVSREGCMKREYEQYSVQGRHLDGLKTLGENIADNGGLKLAYLAYHKWSDEHDHDSTLPGLGLTSNQLFFLSFAQIWCEKTTPSYALTDLQIDVHSPGKFRVDVTLKNSQAFAEAFKCPANSPMNPVNKCAVW